METIEAQAIHFSVGDIITMTARLAQVLANEADLLQEMKMKEISELQDEKMKLTTALEKQKQVVRGQPEILASVTQEERQELGRVVELFNVVLNENHRKLQTARAVNQRVVQAITETVREKSGNPIYTMSGITQAHRNTGISVTLNQTA